MTFGVKEALIPEFLCLAEVRGEAVGFVYSLPDVNQAIHGTHLAALRGAPAEPAFHAIDRGVLQIIGVREAHRRRGINLALVAKSYLAMTVRGYTSASYTTVLDDNWPARRTAERFGGPPRTVSSSTAARWASAVGDRRIRCARTRVRRSLSRRLQAVAGSGRSPSR